MRYLCLRMPSNGGGGASASIARMITLSTHCGALALQDMDMMINRSNGMIFYGIYFFLMAVVLLNLLIAMFASTYERVQETSVKHWRFLTMCRHTRHPAVR